MSNVKCGVENSLIFLTGMILILITNKIPFFSITPTYLDSDMHLSLSGTIKLLYFYLYSVNSQSNLPEVPR